MNVELIKIPQDVAREKLRAYRKAINERHHSEAARVATAEWEQIEAGYKAAARGLPLIELSKAMAAGGWDEQGRPRFAVARADRKRVRCWSYNSLVRFHDPAVSEYRRCSMQFEFQSPDFMAARPRSPGH